MVVLFCMAQLGAFAQYKLQVLNSKTNEAVPFSNIYYPDSKTGITADSAGKFSINTSQKSLLVQVSALGYKTYLGMLKLEDTKGVVYLEPSTHELQEVVVSGNSLQLQGENVQHVEKLSLRNDAGIEGISLSEKLASVPGVSNYSTGVGIGKPVIRGLSGNRVAVFSQGVRVENQQWGDEHGLGLDENGYEQVEIIKGPASLLYGSDALGGVLYFADERYAKMNSIEGLLGSEYNSNTNGWRNIAAFKLSKNRFHWNMFGGYTTHEDYKDGNNDLVANSRFHTGDFKTAFGYTGDKYTTSFKYNFLNEQYGLTEEGEEAIANGRKPLSPYQDLTTHLFSWENTMYFNNESKLKADFGYVANNRKEFEDAAEAALNMQLSTLSYNAKWYSPKLNDRWAFIAGSQGMYQTNTNHGEEVLIPNAATADIGVFATSDYYYSGKSYWQIGLRVDGRQIDSEEHGTDGDEGYIPKFSKSYTAFNFSTGIYQALTDEWSFRLNLASGYRAPNMFELLSNGVHEGTNRYEIGNPDLKTENSYQMDASLDYRTEHLELFASPYFNYIRNYIYLEPSGEIREELPVYYYKQTNAYLYGGEAGFHFHPHPLDWLHLEGSYSSTFGQDEHQNDLPLIPAQKISGTLRATFSGVKTLEKFSFFLQDIYTLEQNRIADYELPTGAYNLVNAGVDFAFNIYEQKVLLNLSVNNIFNKTYYDHLSRYKTESIYNIGRNVCVKLSVPLAAW